MSDEETNIYKDGDIVWVKLGPCWWPGEVTENGPEDLNVKKPPLVIVKFFNESTYEFVKSYNNIYFYNCERKNEFIKKGMDSYRANNSHMEKFPGDVTLAEMKIGGNANILSDPMFIPQKKSNIIAEIFGTPNQKKSNKEGARHSKGRPSKGSSKKSQKITITHRRFLGCDDYEAHIRVQYPGKDNQHQSSDEEEITRLNAEPSKSFPCSLCEFQTNRLEVMFFHVQCHSKGIVSPVTMDKKPKKVKKPRISKKTISSSGDERTNSSTGYVITDSEDELPLKPKRKRKSQSTSKTTIPKKTVVEVEKPATDIRTDLLAEWSDGDDENDEAEISKVDVSFNISTDKSKDEEKETKKEENETKREEKEAKKEEQNNQLKGVNKSCFDFDDDDEEDNDVIHAAVGRKIPRVIPPSEKRKSSDPDDEDASLPVAEDDENRMEILKVNESLNENSDSVQNEDLSKDFKELMDSTSVPDVPDVQNFVKSEQSLSPSRLVKTSEKKTENGTEIATKLTNPKKRFVKSFEDFELLQHEQRKAQEEKENQEKEKLKKEKLEEDKKSDPNYIPEKVRDSTLEETKTETTSPLQTEKLEETIKNIDNNLQISKLKCQIMSKLGDEEPESPVSTRTKTAHRTPRSKILESYRSDLDDTTERKSAKKVDDKSEDSKSLVNSSKKEKQTPKKSSYWKTNQDSEESIEKIEEESPEPDSSKDQILIKEVVEESEIPDKILESSVIEPETDDKEPEIKESDKVEETNSEVSVKEAEITSTNQKDETIEMSNVTIEQKLQENQENILDDSNTEENKDETIEPEVATESGEIIQEKTIPEQEVSKPVNQIDEYFSDLLFNFDKKSETSEIEETKEKASDSTSNSQNINEDLQTKDVNNEEDAPVVDISFKTTVPSFDRNEEDMSALSTLAMVSELETTLDHKKPSLEELFAKKPESELVAIDGKYSPDDHKEPSSEELFPEKPESELVTIDGKHSPDDHTKPSFEELFPKKSESKLVTIDGEHSSDDQKEPSSEELFPEKPESELVTTDGKHSPDDHRKPSFEELFPKKSESELVTIDGNLTVVSEKDLVDAQVEITSDASQTCKKPVTLTNFSMDFSECNSSNSDSLPIDSNVKSPEETSKEKKATDKKNEENEIRNIPIVGDMCDLEEHIPSQIVGKPKSKIDKPAITTATSKLLERLTTVETKTPSRTPKVPVTITKDSTKTSKAKLVKPTSKQPAHTKTPQVSKPIIISEKIIKPEKPINEVTGSVSVQKITSKRNMQDADEIDTFIIQKESKKVDENEELEVSLDVKSKGDVPVKRRRTVSNAEPKISAATSSSAKKRGKAKILQQTIITPAGEIIHPTGSQPQQQPVVQAADDNMFDINAMPIVLSDQILTPDSIENMPIFLSDSIPTTSVSQIVTTAVTTTAQKMQPSIIRKPQAQGQMRLLNKSMASSNLVSNPIDKTQKIVKTTKIVGSVGQKIIKQNSFSASKPGKYVIVTQPSSSPHISKYSVGKKHAIIKRASELTAAGTLTKVQNIPPEPTGNKVMILTDQHGEQQKVLLTPAQQKMFGFQTQGNKVTKTIMKGNVIQKPKDGQVTAIPSTSGLISKNINSPRLNTTQTLISSSGHVLTSVHSQQNKNIRIEKTLPQRKIQIQSQKVNIKPQQKTILIKNQHGQTVKKIQGTDDALLDQQVAEQLEAIKASGSLQQKQEVTSYKSATTKGYRRSYVRKPVESSKPIQKSQLVAQTIAKTEAALPPLTPISPKRSEQVVYAQPEKSVAPTPDTKTQTERPLHQLVIQDAMGNQTTITEGQILALPNETVDGQPQSYMLVTLDEFGNLTPLNSEALADLEMEDKTGIQIDENALKVETATTQAEVVSDTPSISAEVAKSEVVVEASQPDITKSDVTEEISKVPESVQLPQEEIVDPSVMQAVNNVGSDSGQQLIVTGDPIAAQKFLESLTEGNADLANILASAEGSSILIHADGQQILINTDSDNQMLLSVNADNLNIAENTEGGGNPIFATQSSKNQDILAAALADTDVFQQDQNGSHVKVSQLSPNSALYPMNVGNVLETSLTLNSPIMTPLEVPSTNSKKISDENDILNQVPKNVDLPITITDPNISQTVSQQQVATLMASELQNNLELTLPISDSSITVSSSEMNSPNFAYSLPSLDGSDDISQKPFNSSMPLLTEDTEDRSNEMKEMGKTETTVETSEETIIESDDKNEPKVVSENSAAEFLDENEGLCTLGSEMCSSLSEPPPDMFDLSAVLAAHQAKAEKINSDKQLTETSSNIDETKDPELAIDDKGGEDSVSSESVNPETTSIAETSSPNTVNEDSCEIPVQPEIVTTLVEDGFGPIVRGEKRGSLDDDDENERKKCKFD